LLDSRELLHGWRLLSQLGPLLPEEHRLVLRVASTGRHQATRCTRS
jgi:hypothetical protein